LPAKVIRRASANCAAVTCPNSVLAACYYLRVIVVMYMHAPAEEAEELPALAAGVKVALGGSAAATVVLGVFPSLVLDAAGKAAQLVK
jgi:NADH-quinone oxidoreductase subunit N